MKFRDDIDPKNTWVISDTHFGHDNIVGFCHRPLDHEELMLAEIRAHVPADGTLLHLGDLAYKGNARFKHITANGREGLKYIKDKKLIRGNHDHQRPSFYRDCGFQVCRPFKIAVAYSHETGGITLDDDGDPNESPFGRMEVSFSHYQWGEPDDEGEMPSNHLRLHGHIHNNGYTRDAFVPFLRNHVNLSVEQTKYRPVNLKALLDAVLLGVYPATTEAQLDEARRRKAGER